MVDAPTLLPEGPPDDRSRLGYAMVATAATLFAVNGSVSKVVLASGLSSLGLAPIFVALFARFVYKEQIRRRIWVAVILCIAGLAIVVEVWAGVAFSTVGVTAALGGAFGLTAYLLMAGRGRGNRPAGDY